MATSPPHTHPHEQITMVEKGRVHGATMLDEEVILVDIFTPVREDLLPG